jgi:hypothetical protein
MIAIRGAVKKIIRRVNPRWEEDLKDYLFAKRMKRSNSDLQWLIEQRCPRKRVEGQLVVINDRAYMLNGYESLEHVWNNCDVFDLRSRKWVESFPTPVDLPQTHAGIVTDGKRYLFSVAGQLGPHCFPCTDQCFVYDVEKREWATFPSLPGPVYVGTAQYWNDRIHVVGGARPDRITPIGDHWSIGVKKGKPLENEWLREVPIPRGGIHRGSAIVDNRLYVIGGAEGHVAAIPGDPLFLCDWNTPPENYHGEVYMLESPASSWLRLKDMPIKTDHNEGTTVVVGRNILVLGGNLHRYQCSDAILQYDVDADQWSEIGHLPYPMKSTNACYYDGWIYLITGQRSVAATNRRPGDVLSSVWRARYPYHPHVSV